MSVHYKFKSSLNYDTVTFDGLHISVGDLKKSIMQQKKIGKSSDFDLQITNAQTKEVYESDEALVPKNTSVIVARVPISAANKKSWERSDIPVSIQDSDPSSHVQFDKIVKTADLAHANASEDEKIKAMMSQSSQEYDPSKFVKSRSMTGPLPSNYMCFRCGKSGHWIKSCPTNNMDIKRSTGIPRSFMVPVDGPDHKGALLTSTGEYAVPLIDHEAYKEVKKEKPPFLNVPEPEPEPEPQLPEELLCMACRDLLQDAVLIPCCGNSFCDECARQALLDSENHECPICHETDISPDTLIPNRFLRTAVLNFKNETGYTRGKKSALQPPIVSLSSSTVITSSPSAAFPASDATSVSVPDSNSVPAQVHNLVPPLSAMTVSQVSPSHLPSSVSVPSTTSIKTSSAVLRPVSPSSSSISVAVPDKVSDSLITTGTNSNTSILHPVEDSGYLPDPSPALHPDSLSTLPSDENMALPSESHSALSSDTAPSLVSEAVLAAPDSVHSSTTGSVITMLPEPLMPAYSETVSTPVPIIEASQLPVGSTLEVQQLPQLEGSRLEVPPLSYNEVELSSLPPIVHDPEQVDALPDLGIGVDDGQPGTPLADEPPVDLEPIDTVDQHVIPEDATCIQNSPFCSFPSDVIDPDSREAMMHPSEENPSGNIIMTITTSRERGHAYMNSNSRRRHPAIHPHIRIMRNLHGQEDRSCHQSMDASDVADMRDHRRDDGDNGRTRHLDQQEGRASGSHRSRDQMSGHGSRSHRAREQAYPRRGGSRNQVRDLPQRASSHGRSGRHSSRIQYGTPPREREYRSTSSNYRHSYSDYNQHHTSVQVPSNYDGQPQQPASHSITPRFSVQPPQHRIGAPNYPGQVPPRPPGPSHVMPPTFPPQPPPPGSSPLSHVPPPPGQPPPPGVSPVLPPGPPLAPHHHGSFPPALYGAKSYGTEDLHRDLQRLKDRGIGEAMDDFTRELLEYRREQQHRSHGRRHQHGRSRSSSGSHSYSTSKSWSRSGSHSSRSWSRSRSHSFSYSSRSRSRSYSRSRSRSRNRSYSRSRSRSRSYHSRSRSRSRERHPAPSHHYNRSHSQSPKNYRSRGQRSPFQHKKEFSPSFFGTTFSATYPTSAASVPSSTSIPHAHSHTPNHPLEHYDDRYRYYHDQFRGYEAYHNYSNQRYDVHNLRHESKHVQEYQKQGEDVHQKVQSRDKEKGRDSSRSRGGRDVHKKDIVKPAASSDGKGSSSKDIQDEVKTKKKEEKIKHKKHHHRNKESKKEKQENVENKSSDLSKSLATPVNVVKMDVLTDNNVESKKPPAQKETVVKEKKHKHKKRKENEVAGKKKSKNAHKEKSSTVTSSESDTAIKAKKKKGKSQIPVISESFTVKEQKETAPIYVQKGLLSETYTEKTAEEDVTSKVKVSEKTISEEVEPQKDEQVISKSDETEPVELLKQVEVTGQDLTSESKKENLAEFTGNNDEVENASDYTLEQDVAHNEAMIEQNDATEEQSNKTSEENEDTASDDVLHVEIPAISKWEREEYEDMEETRSPHRNIKAVQKEERNSLPSDIIQRAEKAILQKALKAAIIEIPPSREKHKSDRKINAEKLQRSGEPNKESVYLKEKELLTKDQLSERKELISSKERVESPTIQITITTDKEKRSVQTKKKSSAKERNVDSDSSQSKKMKLDRSKFTEKSQSEEDFYKFSNVEGNQPDKAQNLVLSKDSFSRLSLPKRENEDSEKIPKKSKGRKQNSERLDKNFDEIEKKCEEKDTSSKKYTNNRELLGYIPDESHSSDGRLSHVHSRKSDKNINKVKDYHTVKGVQVLRGGGDERRNREYRTEPTDMNRERRVPLSTERYKMAERVKKLQRERSRSRSYDSRDSRNSERKQHRKLKSYDDSSEIKENKQRDVNKRGNEFNDEKERKKTTGLNKNSNRERSKVIDSKDQDVPDKKIKVADKKMLVGPEYPSSTRHQKESTQDESKFEPNYDETSESEKSSDADILEKKSKHMDSGKKRKASSPSEADSPKKHSKRESSIKVHSEKMAPLLKNFDQTRHKLEAHKRGKSSSVSSSGSLSQSDIESSSTEKSVKKKIRSESVESEHKHKHKKSRHKKHKKHKHKHKKKKSYKSRQRD